MNKLFLVISVIFIIAGCSDRNNQAKQIPVARAGNVTLYYDEIPVHITENYTEADSSVMIHNYINKWAKQELLFQKAMENLPPELIDDINRQIEDTRINLVVHEYQRIMMLQKMDTIISEEELRSHYDTNEKSFILRSNIVKALFIKLPVETPNLYRIRTLARSTAQKDMQELESLCFQFAEKFDDFNEKWITMDRLLFEMKTEISNQENFLRWNKFYETNDSTSICFMTINDYRLRGTLAPFEYVREDIKRIIWNNRRLKFINELENGIYNEALKENGFKIF
jgi:hypothetical protein